MAGVETKTSIRKVLLMVFRSGTGAGRPQSPGVISLAGASGGAFASFYCFYSGAPLIYTTAQAPAGVVVGVLMVVVVLIQPFVLAVGPWTRNRARVVRMALLAIAAGLAALPFGILWPGLIILGVGFGVFVVTATAWAKELAAPENVGWALGVYGFGSAIGGAVGAPVGLLLAARFGASGVVLGGTVFALLAVLPVLAVAKNMAYNGSAHLAKLNPGASPITDGVASGAGLPNVAGVLVVMVTLAAHLLAVVLYATVLSSAASLVTETTAIAAVLAVFATQSTVALGRLASGALCDHSSAVGTAASAAVLLVISVACFTVPASTPLVKIGASAAVGAGAGMMQTAALTLMMRRAQTPARTEQVSAAWNIAFDLGLGAGAVLAGIMALA